MGRNGKGEIEDWDRDRERGAEERGFDDFSC